MPHRLSDHQSRPLWYVGGFVLTWLGFECFISWAAFCQQAEQYGRAYKAAEENYCVFRGPLSITVRGFMQWWGHAFEKPDAYVALFTAALVASTVYLWLATKRTADIAERTLSEFERLWRIDTGVGYWVQHGGAKYNYQT